jgi:hypothetical protein
MSALLQEIYQLPAHRGEFTRGARGFVSPLREWP